jgi:hypothetical protein
MSLGRQTGQRGTEQSEDGQEGMDVAEEEVATELTKRMGLPHTFPRKPPSVHLLI